MSGAIAGMAASISEIGVSLPSVRVFKLAVLTVKKARQASYQEYAP